MEEEKKTHVRLGYGDVALNRVVGDKTCARCGSFRAFGGFGYGKEAGTRGYCFVHQASKEKEESCDKWH